MPKLTERFLAALSVEKDRKDRLVFDTVSPGLGVRVTAKGTRRFIVQWTDPVTKRKVREPLGIWGKPLDRLSPRSSQSSPGAGRQGDQSAGGAVTAQG